MGSSKWESNFYIALGMFFLSKKPLFLLDYRRNKPVVRTLEKYIVNYEPFKPRPNDRNKPTQHVATLLGAICCAAFGHLVAMCCDMLGIVGSTLKMVKFEPTTPDKSQHVATSWPNARNILRPTMLRHVALPCCDRLVVALNLVKFEPTTPVATCRNKVAKRTRHIAPNNVAIYAALACCDRLAGALGVLPTSRVAYCAGKHIE